MKKIICFLFFVIVSCGNAQNLNVARHRNLDVPTNMVSINSKSFYSEAIGTCCQDSFNVVGINNSGQTIVKTKLSGFGTYWMFPKKVIETKEKEIVVFGYGIGACDLMNRKNFLTKLDTTGAVIFQTTVDLSPINHQWADITQYLDSSFILIPKSNSKYVHYSKNGVLTGSTTTIFNGMNAIATLTNGNLLINGRISNVLSNVEIALNNVVVSQQTTSNLIKKFVQYSSGSIYGLDSLGVLINFSPILTPLNNSTISLGANAVIRDFVIKNDSVYCAGTISPSNTAFYAVLNSTLGVLYNSQSSYKNVYPTGITVNNKNKISIVTYGTSNKNTEMSFSSIYQTSKIGNFQSKYDVGVIGYSVITGSIYNMPANGYVPNLNLNVRVKNYTADTIKSFYLNHYAWHIFCPQYLHKRYNIIIFPFDTVGVNTGQFFGPIMYIPGGPQPGVIYKREICITSSVPNFENDVEIANDDFCDTVAISIPVGLNENNLAHSNFKIFPNPFNQSLDIESDVLMEKIIIYNVMGENIFEESVNQKSCKLSDSRINSGIYFIRIETEDGFMVKKVVRE